MCFVCLDLNDRTVHNTISKVYQRICAVFDAVFIFLVRARNGAKSDSDEAQLKKMKFGGIVNSVSMVWF